MATRTYRLIYPPSLLRRPIINQVILEFELSVNIIQAHVTQEEGWLEIQVAGEPDEIKRAMNWLTKEGISITSID
jgi:ABC-type methionine transport system ATPase subunit